MKNLVLVRHTRTDKETVGTLHVYENGRQIARFATVELPWKDNARNVSCIPKGDYQIVPRETIKYGSHFLVQGVRGRSAILIHFGNFYTDIRGCILIGTNHADINKDGELDVVNSRSALLHLTRLVKEPVTLTITEAFEDAG